MSDSDAIIAEHLMGLRPGADWGEFPLHEWQESVDEYNRVWCPRCWTGYEWQTLEETRRIDPGPCRKEPPCYTHYPMLAKAEAEIARRGLVEAYTTALLEEVNPEAGIYHSAIEVETHIGAHRDGWSLVFAIATAPPGVRVRAMVKVLEAHSPNLLTSPSA